MSTHVDWPYPGARWWKFDFHTHTPASKDTPWSTQSLTLSPEQWLLKFMSAGIDCVCVTDHNSGAWIDTLKNTYAKMKTQADAGIPPDGFREMTLFPGVEISAQGGVHILAIFEPSATNSDIDTLLGRVEYDGTKGDSDGETRKGVAEVIEAVSAAGAIPVPAHADNDKGLLRINTGTRECALSANMVRQAIGVDGLVAVEWVDRSHPWPQCVEREAGRFAQVLGSDCHSVQGNNIPGSRYTWVKMATPTLEGLRLALLDGNGVSIRRSDEGPFDPFQRPAQFITVIEVDSARFMGNGQGQTARLELSPYYNALIGGRGTGKSTIVHAMRLAFRREQELKRLGENAEPYLQFGRFRKTVKGRDGEGALRDETEIRVELTREGIRHRLHWRADGQGAVVEEQDHRGLWRPSSSQAVTADRFPLRLFSQGQIAAMAGDGRQALLDVIDEAANVAPLKQAVDEAKRTYFTQRARLRELNGKFAGRAEVERKLTDLTRKLETFTQSHHAEVLQAHVRAQRQRREVEQTLDQLHATSGHIEALAEDLLLDDWPAAVFEAGTEDDMLAWRRDAEKVLARTREALKLVVAKLKQQTTVLEGDARFTAWRGRVEQVQEAYRSLQEVLAAQGVTDPQAFGRLVQERQQLETQIKQIDQVQRDHDRLLQDIEAQWKRVLHSRQAISEARDKFIEHILHANPFVRMKVVPFGFDARSIERELRDLLDASDRFENDILRLDPQGEPEDGLAHELAKASDRAQMLESIKRRLLDRDNAFGGHFRNYLDRKLEKPEFGDHIRTWFPEDDLRIEYSRSGDGRDWAAITQGSQGQRSAALLAFLLAFGGEPLVLDQPEDDLDNHLIYDVIVRQIRENKLRRQMIIVTHNPNVVVNGDAEMVHAFDFRGGQCRVIEKGALQEKAVRDEVCRVMEGGREAFARRWARLGREF